MGAQTIIFVNRFFYPDHSATSRILSDLAFAMSKEGRRVQVITARGLYDNPNADLPSLETLEGVIIHRVYQPRFSRKGLWGRMADYFVMHIAFFAALARLAKRNDYVVVKTDPPLLCITLAPVALMKRLKLVNWLQDLYPEVALTLGLRALRTFASPLVFIRNLSLKAARQNVVISAAMRDLLLAAHVPADRISTIENWCDDEAIRPIPQNRNFLRNDWGLAKKFVVAYSGNLGRAHEYETLVNGAERLRNYGDIVFLFIGGGFLTEPLKRAITDRGLEANFQFFPYQPDDLLPLSLSVADIHWISHPPALEGLILPSKFYGIAAAGRPIVVIGDINGEFARMIQTNNCGAAIALGDDAALANFILATRNDPALRQEMGANARKMLDENFTRKNALDRWSALVERL